ncbi:MAG: MerR family transcriptional regulator [Planctomycetes bacterium]|jgi:DNA-binding transcriptional MerR regulator|nr:MerR family transcriptional regulator [Phycisphaerae bacterium]NBB94327.1 MerR family transcriptional regulator [Planctomycetota bacterium]
MPEWNRQPDTHAETDDDALMRISDVAEAAGVTKSTVEYYCMLGLIRPHRRGRTRGRWFDEDHVRRIRLIRKLNRSGYTLRDIRQIYIDPSRR